MGDKSGIEWTDATWNPVVGCSKVSPGCDNCYAITQAERIQRMGGKGAIAYEGTTADGDWSGLVRTLPERLDQPLKWRRPRRIFVNSMSDLFHPDVDDQFIARVFAVMALAKHHQFQVLTKRSARMRATLARRWETEGINSFESWTEHFVGDYDQEYPVVWPLPNVWLGTSIESDRYAFRARMLRETPAAIRFLSLEPLLGPLPSLQLDGIDWVIVGGESGPGARPMHPDWVRDIRDACVFLGLPFFFKQWGAWVPAAVEDDSDFSGGRAFDHPLGGRHSASIRERSRKAFTSGETRLLRPGDETKGGTRMLDANTVALNIGKHKAGRELDGRTWDQYPDLVSA